MSEKRFIFELVEISDVDNDKLVEVITDKEKNYSYGELDEVVFVLNEQQATITHLEKVNGKNFAKRRLLEQDNLILRNENKQLRQKLDFYLLDEFEWKEKYGDD